MWPNLEFSALKTPYYGPETILNNLKSKKDCFGNFVEKDKKN